MEKEGKALFRAQLAELSDVVIFCSVYFYGAQEETRAMVDALIKEYEKMEEYALRDILDFHVRFEVIFPFEDGNGRIGRLIMFKECLRHNVTPFILDDKRRGRYLEGLQCWKRNKHVLTEVVEESQQRFLAQVALQSVMERGPQIRALGESQE